MVILGISGGASLGNQYSSANVKGEPIVNTPIQALATSFSTGMDALFIGNFDLKKNNNSFNTH